MQTFSTSQGPHNAILKEYLHIYSKNGLANQTIGLNLRNMISPQKLTMKRRPASNLSDMQVTPFSINLVTVINAIDHFKQGKM